MVARIQEPHRKGQNVATEFATFDAIQRGADAAREAAIGNLQAMAAIRRFNGCLCGAAGL